MPAFRHSGSSGVSREAHAHGNVAVMSSLPNPTAMLITGLMKTSATGCAAVFKGSAQTVHFESVADGTTSGLMVVTPARRPSTRR